MIQFHMLAPMSMWHYVTSAKGMFSDSFLWQQLSLRGQSAEAPGWETQKPSNTPLISWDCHQVRGDAETWRTPLTLALASCEGSYHTRQFLDKRGILNGNFETFFFFGFWDQHFPHKSVVWNLLIWLSNTFSAMHHVFKCSPACLPTTQVLLLLLRCHLFRWTSWGQEFLASLSPLHHQWNEMATWQLVSVYPRVMGTCLEKECVLFGKNRMNFKENVSRSSSEQRRDVKAKDAEE